MLKKRVRLLGRNYVSNLLTCLRLNWFQGFTFWSGTWLRLAESNALEVVSSPFKIRGEKQITKVLSICCFCARLALSRQSEWWIWEWNAFHNRCQNIYTKVACKTLLCGWNAQSFPNAFEDLSWAQTSIHCLPKIHLSEWHALNNFRLEFRQEQIFPARCPPGLATEFKGPSHDLIFIISVWWPSLCIQNYGPDLSPSRCAIATQHGWCMPLIRIHCTNNHNELGK